ncbi:uncharacterized protein BYT42DRAFT_625857 [Radiomyces spectabilis]|uniref:uncharacterized protein n=1 Tax=Radiomyces spectabilis TaxID=64574 RepID=UPI0022209B3F|nr:uncharacterized protein BYT42DRAFT_625857 [Radiomyces spectabilis]KAI8366635.1 hypothetical protein BYT42DRAFT_625857 [Radiomyces spectabilis]
MTKPEEVPTLETINEFLRDDTRVKLAVVDIDGVLRGKIMHKTKFLNIVEEGFGFCSVVHGWDIEDQLYTQEIEFSGKEAPYFDFIAKIDLSSFRRIPWENNVPFFLVSLVHPKTREPLYCCPRTLLESACDDLMNTYGYTAYCGTEFEFFCFKETPEALKEKGFTNLNPLTVGMCGYSILRPTDNQEFYYNAFDWLREFRVDIESWHSETGPGVFEAALAYVDAREAGDRAALFKTSMKQIARKHGFMASFMAKPYQDLPGCSGHTHFSLKDKNGRNVFAIWDKSEESEIPGVSKTMYHFLAGLLRGLPSIMAILAPTVNSYKRLVERFWAPITVSWGIDNRRGAVRIIVPPASSPNGARMEVRVPGSDINAHLVYAAVLKCGYWGIRTSQTMPIGPLSDKVDLDTQSGEKLARTLQEATAAMEAKGSVAREVLGDDFVNHFVKTRRHEWTEWVNAVTDYERKRYMELI